MKFDNQVFSFVLRILFFNVTCYVYNLKNTKARFTHPEIIDNCFSRFFAKANVTVILKSVKYNWELQTISGTHSEKMLKFTMKFEFLCLN